MLWNWVGLRACVVLVNRTSANKPSMPFLRLTLPSSALSPKDIKCLTGPIRITYRPNTLEFATAMAT